MTDVTATFDHREPGDVGRLIALARERRLELPEDYLEFMARSDGGSGMVGEAWIELWPIDHVLEAAESRPMTTC